jgi:ribonuclease-3
MQTGAAKLEALIGHRFKDPQLLVRALTHRSWAYEEMPGESDDAVRRVENESMEFVGDSVLGLVIAERLFRDDPDATEGDMTLMKHHLVSTVTLARVAEKMSLGEFVRVGRGEEKTGGRKKQALLANTLEAVIAAVFLDGGYSAARVFLNRIFTDEIRNATPESSLDYKTMLQELLQGSKMPAPAYKVIETTGPPHSRIFTVEATWDTGSTTASGNSIKSAEMKAAADALAMLDGNNRERPSTK